MSERVTICIPAYRAGQFLHETIESALAQSWPAIDIAISVDPGDDDTWAVAQRYAGHGGVRAVLQPQRLGWVGNTNAAFALAETRFAMNLPHDDLIAPDYVAACMAHLAARPDAVLAYSDLDRLGDRQRVTVQETIEGGTEERLASVLRDHFAAVAVRGVFDRQRAAQFRVPEFALGGFAADTLWVTRMVCQGAIVRVPRVLYTKRMLPGSAHAGWKTASSREKDEMWTAHCLETAATILETLPELEWTGGLYRAWSERVRKGYMLRKSGRMPACLTRARPLAPQVAEVHRKVRARQPHYSWMR